MKAGQVMSHGVVSIAPEAPIQEAIAQMVVCQVSGMPVIDAHGKLVGIITEGDFLRRVETRTEAPRRRWLELLSGIGATADDYARSRGRTVGDVMTTEVVKVTPDTELRQVVRLMEEHAIKRLPVVDGGQVVGIVSRADLMSALGQLLSGHRATAADDDEIRAHIVSELARQPWCGPSQISVTVRHAVVELEGTIFDKRQRRALRVLAEGIGGVAAVDDRLIRIGKRAGQMPPV